MSFADLTIKGTAAVVLASGSSLVNWFNINIAIPIMGVPVTIIAAAVLGSAASLAFGDPITTRKALFGQVAAATVLGASGGALVAHWFNWQSAQALPGPFAMFCALAIRMFLPHVVKRIKEIIAEIKFSWSRKPGKGEDDV